MSDENSTTRNPHIGNDGVPVCSGTNCPKYSKYNGRCAETGIDGPTFGSGVCAPAVRDALKKHADELGAERRCIIDLAHSIAQRDDKIGELRHALRVFGDDRSDLEAERDAIRFQLATCTEENRTRADEEKELRTRVDAAEAHRERLSQETIELTDIREELARSEWRFMDLRNERDGLLRELNDVATVKEQIEHDLRVARDALAQRDEKIRALESTLSIYNGQRDAESLAISKQNEALRAELRALLEGMRSWQKPSEWKIAAKLAAASDPVARFDAARAELHDVLEIKRHIETELAAVNDERTKDLHVMTAQGKAIEELRAQNTKLDAALRAAARAVCKNPLLHGSFVAIDYEQWADGMRKEIATVDELRDAIVNTHSFILAANEHLRSQLHTAAAIRDDARRASQRYLDEKREVEERLRKAVVDWRLEVDKVEAEKRAIEAAGAELTALVARLMPAAQQDSCHGAHVFVGDHCRDCGLHAPRVDVPSCALDIPCKTHDAKPGEYRKFDDCCNDRVIAWRKLTDPRDEMIAMADLQNAKENGASPGPVFAEERAYDTIHLKPTRPCACSPKYIELATGTHAKYCPLAGQPLPDGFNRWRCEACDLTYKRSPLAEKVDTCLKCGAPTKEWTRG